MSSELCMPCCIVEGTLQLINVAVTNQKAVRIILHKIMKFGKTIKKFVIPVHHYLIKCHPEIFVNTSGLMSLNFQH